MRMGAGNVRVTDYRKEVLTRARRVSHVFQDSSILHMNEGLWHSGSCRMHLSSLAHISEPARLVTSYPSHPLCEGGT